MKARVLFLVVALIALTMIAQATSPTANFSANVTMGSSPLPVLFTDTSTGSPSGWAWFFGDEKYNQSFVETNTSSGWTDRFGHCLVTIPEGALLIGGATGSGYAGDIWETTDGVHWILRNASAFPGRAHASCGALTDGRVVVIAGSNGTTPYMNDVWISSDYVHWSLQSIGAFVARDQAALVILSDNMFIISGGYGSGGCRNDTISSSDAGVTWTTQNSSSGWDGRCMHQMTAFQNNYLLLMAGYNLQHVYPFRDVWGSPDRGVSWVLKNTSPGWGARMGSKSVTEPDNSILHFAGYNDTLYYQDAWRTVDGVIWDCINLSVSAVARDSPGVAVLKNGTILYTGGIDSGDIRHSDTWVFNPVLSTVQNPMHTYTENGSYSVSLIASNSSGYNTTRKVDYITIPGSSGSALAMFTQTLNVVRVPNTITFTDTSIGATSWDWSFGDGTANVTTQSPVHRFVRRGLYHLTLIVNGGESFNTSTVRAIGFDFSGT